MLIVFNLLTINSIETVDMSEENTMIPAVSTRDLPLKDQETK